MSTYVIVTNADSNQILFKLSLEEQDSVIFITGDEWLSGEFRSMFIGIPVDLIIFDPSISQDISEQDLINSEALLYDVSNIFINSKGEKTPMKFIPSRKCEQKMTLREYALYILLLSTAKNTESLSIENDILLGWLNGNIKE